MMYEEGSKEMAMKSEYFRTFTAAIVHLKDHELAGHEFPSRAITNLMDDLQKYGDNVAEATKKGKEDE